MLTSPYFLFPAVIFDVIVTGFALWFAARRGDKGWFIVFLLIQLFGIPELIYLIAIRNKKK
jgi:type IV secretory pathway VirB2 component (pilin)